MLETPEFRAYINPVPPMSESAQRAVIAKAGKIAEWYVESKSVSRDDFIKHLRAGNVAVVAHAAYLAQLKGRKNHRFADMVDARGEIHARGAILLEAATGLRSDKDWPKMRAAAQPMLAKLSQGHRSAVNGVRGATGHGYTDKELDTMQWIMVSREYRNWDERQIAMRAKGIKAPGRTWCLNKLPLLVGKIVKPDTKPTRKRSAFVYFIQDDAQVKIGHSVKPRARLRELQCATHRVLKLLATCKGGQQRERLLHKKFAKYRVKGEWFKLSLPIATYIDQIKSVHRKHKS